MFRESRKKKKNISTDEAIKILNETRIGFLAVNGDEGYPYSLPMNYYYDDKEHKIIFHGARVGHKVDALKASDKVCFTVIGPEKIKEEQWAPYVKSVVIFGRCHIIEDSSISEIKLRQLAVKYYPNEELINETINIYGKGVQMYEIEIEHMSGKEVQER